jgi:hypothetical protein
MAMGIVKMIPIQVQAHAKPKTIFEIAEMTRGAVIRGGGKSVGATCGVIWFAVGGIDWAWAVSFEKQAAQTAASFQIHGVSRRPIVALQFAHISGLVGVIMFARDYIMKLAVLRIQSSPGRAPRASDYELQRRVMEAERGNREQRLWIVAVVSMSLSIISAVISVVAVAQKK